MSRFYVPEKNINKDKITISGKEARHILDVMRLSEGDKVVVFDGTGVEYTGFISKAARQARKVVVEVISTKRSSGDGLPEITLCLAIPKKEKMDHIIEKATELGVSRLVPLVTDRMIVRPDDEGHRKKIERWQKIAVEAAKQCGRTDVPEIKEIRKFTDIAGHLNENDLVLFACLSGNTVSVRQALSGFNTGKIMVFIGPEGGFTQEEIEMTDVMSNCKYVTLGQRILKSDTAGLFVLSVLNYELAT